MFRFNVDGLIFISVALLSGARNHLNSRLSKEVYDRMKVLFRESDNVVVSAAVLLANVYGSLGRIEEASSVRKELSKLDTKKPVGVTWTAPDGKLAVRQQMTKDLFKSMPNDCFYRDFELMTLLILGHWKLVLK